MIDAVDELLGSRGDTRPRIHDRLDDLDRLGRQTLQALGHQAVPDRGLKLELSELDAPTAAFLNWADSPDGWAAQGGLWFNPPVPVEHTPGGVDVLLVNERIVEQPYVFGAVARAGPPPIRVLDVGGAESTVGLSLASLGHEVTLVDPRGSRLHHPRLNVVESPLEDLAADDDGFEVAVALSAIEHFGLEHYGQEAANSRADVAAVAQIGDLLRAGGRLVLTVPLGEPSVDEFQRVYDLAGVRALLEGWEIEDLRVIRRRDRLTWVPAEPDDSDRRPGVALVTARR